MFNLEARPGKKALIVGRHGASDLVLHDISVSRRHLEIQVMGDKLMINDLGSKNGTRLNDQLLTPQIPVFAAPGSILKVGEVVLGLRSSVPPKSAETTSQPKISEQSGTSLTPSFANAVSSSANAVSSAGISVAPALAGPTRTAPAPATGSRSAQAVLEQPALRPACYGGCARGGPDRAI